MALEMQGLLSFKKERLTEKKREARPREMLSLQQVRSLTFNVAFADSTPY
jgi:hypothetical protein